MTRSSLTEETPATPGWVDARIDEVLARHGLAGGPARDAYADCLAGVRGAVDVDGGHDRCRRALMEVVGEQVADRDALNRDLMDLEGEISADT